MDIFLTYYHKLLGAEAYVSNPDHHVIFLTHGHFEYTLDGTTLILQSASACYIRPGHTLRLKALDYVAALDLVEFCPTSEQYNMNTISLPCCPTAIPNPSGISSIFWNLDYVFYSADKYRLEKANCFMELILYGIASGEEILNPNATREEQNLFYLRRIRNRIADHPERPYTVAEAAWDMGMSISYFQKLYRRHFHISFGDDLIKFRIRTACSMLNSTDLTGKQIAAALGYSDENYFYRQFKKEMGVTVREYRKLRIMALH